MIKVCRYLYVHWLFAVLAVFCYINRNLETMLLSYAVIAVHELCHLAAAKYIGLECSHITVYPFGLNLKLKNTIIYSLTDEIILYSAGPLANILMSAAVLPFVTRTEFFYNFYMKNLILFFINILPIVPLDGGMILKKILNYRFGFDGGNRAMKIISGLMLSVFLIFTGIFLYQRQFNPSLCIFAVFIVGNIFSSREKYDTNLLKELLYARENKSTKAPHRAEIIRADKNSGKIDIAKKFRMCKSYFVFLTDENSRIEKVLSEEEIIEELLGQNCKN